MIHFPGLGKTMLTEHGTFSCLAQGQSQNPFQTAFQIDMTKSTWFANYIKMSLLSLWWMKIGSATLVNNIETTQKIKNKITTWSSNHTSGHITKGNDNIVLKRYEHLQVHFSIIHKSQDRETTYVSINRLMNKCDVIYMWIWILFSIEKEIFPFATT